MTAGRSRETAGRFHGDADPAISSRSCSVALMKRLSMRQTDIPTTASNPTRHGDPIECSSERIPAGTEAPRDTPMLQSENGAYVVGDGQTARRQNKRKWEERQGAQIHPENALLPEMEARFRAFCRERQSLAPHGPLLGPIVGSAWTSAISPQNLRMMSPRR